MAHEIIVKNTLAFLFPGNAAQPTLADMGGFLKTLKADRSLMDTAYKISDEKCVFIRFQSEDAMKFALGNNNATLPFHYTDGKIVMVQMSVAAGNTRYVRVFDLPPEVPDLDLSAVLEKYGKVKRVVRERFPAEIGLDMSTGVRGLYMDIQKEIPEALYFRGRRGRIYYDGIKSKCYVCKSDAHLKKACPIITARQGDETVQKQGLQEQRCVIELPASDLDEVTGEAAAPVATSGATRKRHNKGKKTTSSTTETKRQLSIDSDANQPQEKKKTIQPDDESESESNDSMITVPDGLQNKTELDGRSQTIRDNDTENESDLEPIDWHAATIEAQNAWLKKKEKKNRRRDREIERLLGKSI